MEAIMTKSLFAQRALMRASRRPNMKPLTEPEVPMFAFIGEVVESGEEVKYQNSRNLRSATQITLIAANPEEATAMALRSTPQRYDTPTSGDKWNDGSLRSGHWHVRFRVEWTSIKQVGA